MADPPWISCATHPSVPAIPGTSGEASAPPRQGGGAAYTRQLPSLLSTCTHSTNRPERGTSPRLPSSPSWRWALEVAEEALGAKLDEPVSLVCGKQEAPEGGGAGCILPGSLGPSRPLGTWRRVQE